MTTELEDSSSSAAVHNLTTKSAASGSKVTAGSDVPWIEKYRPLYLKDIVANNDTINRLQTIAKDGNMPHLLLTGPPGTGKTTSILCLARELFNGNQQLMKEALLEQNASDERGIDVVRNKIKMFAQKKVTMPQSRHKIILLDEADSMTPAAQQALRRIMEIYSSTTRFCLVCNLSSKIIEPIQSRCAIIRYSKIEDKEMLKRLLKICELEGLNGKYSMDGLEALIFVSDGDMRQAINGLQSCFAGFGFVNAENAFKVCDQPHPLKIRSIYQHCLKGDVGQALDELQVLYDMGYSSLDIITTFFRVAKTMKEIDEAKRLEWIKEIGVVQMRVLEGCGSLVQLGGLLARFARYNIPDTEFVW